jgi:ribosomal protein L11 methyltransferase
LALRHGAQRAVGVEIEAEALRLAEANATLNGLAEVCKFYCALNAFADHDFEVVIANLDASSLMTHCAALSAKLRHHGTMLLTGFLVEQAPEVSEAFAAKGVKLAQVQEADGWSLLEGRFQSRC